MHITHPHHAGYLTASRHEEIGSLFQVLGSSFGTGSGAGTQQVCRQAHTHSALLWPLHLRISAAFTQLQRLLAAIVTKEAWYVPTLHVKLFQKAADSQ